MKKAIKEVYKNYSLEDLKSAFDKVADPDDWRGEIATSMPGECVNLVVAAIQFYTATNPKVALDIKTMRYLVTSKGYRMGPAGDH